MSDISAWRGNDKIQMMISIPLIIISDYFSLFVVRRCLNISKTNIWLSIFLASVCGILAIEAVMIVTLIVYLFRVSSTFTGMPFMKALIVILNHKYIGTMILHQPIIGVLKVLSPALFVHLWLPLFLIGALTNSGLTAFFRAAGLAQWFIKRGDQHPFEAIGMTASAVVFVGASAWQAISYFLVR